MGWILRSVVSILPFGLWMAVSIKRYSRRYLQRLTEYSQAAEAKHVNGLKRIALELRIEFSESVDPAHSATLRRTFGDVGHECLTY